MTLLEELKEMIKDSSCSNVHDAESWRDRGESMGAGAIATITTEDELYEKINFHHGVKAFEEASDRLDAIAGKHGCWWELGYAWSIHFYKVEEDPNDI